jgi:hypothetical protein
MTRSKMILVIVCALGLGSYCLWKSNVDTEKPEQPAVVESMKGTLVYALRDIKKGSVVTSDSVETRLLSNAKSRALPLPMHPRSLDVRLATT